MLTEILAVQRKGRFIQPDTIVPGPSDPQSLNRYMYVNGNPIRYSDSSGHAPLPPNPLPACPIIRMSTDYGFISPLDLYHVVPTALGVREKLRAKSGEEHSESLALTADWYFELGEQERRFQGDSQIIDALIRDEGVAQARQAFVTDGRQDMIGSEKWHDYKFGLKKAVLELATDAITKGDWSTSFLGGYQVEIANISEFDEYSTVEIRVLNTTG